MELLNILPTNNSPGIFSNPWDGKIKITGNSLPENAADFYLPLINWLKSYMESPCETTEISIKMTMLNTSSRKIFLDIFELLNELMEKSEVKVIWYYHVLDDDIEEIGLDFKENSKVEFEFISFETEDN